MGNDFIRINYGAMDNAASSLSTFVNTTEQALADCDRVAAAVFGDSAGAAAQAYQACHAKVKAALLDMTTRHAGARNVLLKGSAATSQTDVAIGNQLSDV